MERFEEVFTVAEKMFEQNLFTYLVETNKPLIHWLGYTEFSCEWNIHNRFGVYMILYDIKILETQIIDIELNPIFYGRQRQPLLFY